jgi:hypothetical protein
VNGEYNEGISEDEMKCNSLKNVTQIIIKLPGAKGSPKTRGKIDP